MSKSQLKNLMLTLVAGTLLAGCGYAPLPVSPTTNDVLGGSQLVRQQAVPQLPSGVTARALTISPAQTGAFVGQSLTMAISITGSDNKTYNDPRLVTWNISNPQLGYIDQNGVLRADMAGSLRVTATLNGKSAESTVQVEPARYAWQQVISPAGTDLHAVKMVTRYDAWAGGDKGTLLRYVNGAWYKEPTFRQTDANIRGLGFANSNDGWAVGNRSGGNVPFISRWFNGMWTTQKLPIAEGFLNAVSVVNDHDVWAVGQAGGSEALILHFDGKLWRQVQAPAKGKLNDIQMLSGKRGWAVGKESGISGMPLIIKYQDGQWVKSGMWNNRDTINLAMGQELTAIKMVSETQGYAVGIRDPLLFKNRGLFLQYEPKRDGWVDGQYDSSVANLDSVPLYDIEMISGTEGWALGQVRKPDVTFQRNPQSIFGNLLRNDGGVLKLDTNYFSGNLSGAFYAIDLLPQGEGFVVGENGVILQRTYDWRGINNNTNTNYDSSNGLSSNQQVPVTYGPGGQQVPATQQSPLP